MSTAIVTTATVVPIEDTRPHFVVQRIISPSEGTREILDMIHIYQEKSGNFRICYTLNRKGEVSALKGESHVATTLALRKYINMSAKNFAMLEAAAARTRHLQICALPAPIVEIGLTDFEFARATLDEQLTLWFVANNIDDFPPPSAPFLDPTNVDVATAKHHE